MLYLRPMDRGASPVRGEVPGTAELLRRLVDHLPAMLAYWDAELRCHFANRAYETWFGVKPQDLLGRHISELLGPLYEANRPYIEGALRGEEQFFEGVNQGVNPRVLSLRRGVEGSQSEGTFHATLAQPFPITMA